MNFLVKKLFPPRKKHTGEDDALPKDPEAIQQERKKAKQIAKFIQLPNGVETERSTVYSIPVEILRPKKQSTKGFFLYFHGGGHCSQSIATHHGWVAILTKYANTTSYMPEFRLAPEFPFPSALDDVYHVYQWLIQEQKINPGEIIIGGDSAGGNLALALLLKLKALKEPLPAGGILFSPWTDMSNSIPSRKTKKHEDPVLQNNNLDLCANRYLGDRDRKQPLVSPLFGDLAGLPPLFIMAGTREILLDDSVLLAQKITEIGGKVDIKVWDGMVHDFPVYQSAKFVGRWLRECKQANLLAAEYIQKFLT